MTNRNDRSRKKARKKRKLDERDAQAKAEEERRLHPTPPMPVNHSRLLQVFSTMSFRSHERGGTRPFEGHVHGPSLTASTPEELVERMDEAYVGETLKQEPS